MPEDVLKTDSMHWQNEEINWNGLEIARLISVVTKPAEREVKIFEKINFSFTKDE